MDILYLLIPLSAGLALLVLALFGWALHRGQFDELEREGERILDVESGPFDVDQGGAERRREQSPSSKQQAS